MPTQGRIVYDGAVCHIIQIGNNKQKIFRQRKDYEKFISVIKEYKNKFQSQLYNYCLMPNHVHLLLKISKGAELSKLMQGIFQSYRFYHKREFNYTGYLYQGRYKSKLIEKDSYLLDCARYIERNPLRAGIVRDLSIYKWSSYNFYAQSNRSDIIAENPLYSTLGNDSMAIQRAYKKYVLQPRAYEEIIDKEFKLL